MELTLNNNFSEIDLYSLTEVNGGGSLWKTVVGATCIGLGIFALCLIPGIGLAYGVATALKFGYWGCTLIGTGSFLF